MSAASVGRWAMSEMERRRIRKEAADAVTSRSPSASDEAMDSALRRYLGIEIVQMLGRNNGPRSNVMDIHLGW